MSGLQTEVYVLVVQTQQGEEKRDMLLTEVASPVATVGSPSRLLKLGVAH